MYLIIICLLQTFIDYWHAGHALVVLESVLLSLSVMYLTHTIFSVLTSDALYSICYILNLDLLSGVNCVAGCIDRALFSSIVHALGVWYVQRCQ